MIGRIKQPLPYLQDWCRQLKDRVLLLADHSLAFLDEAHGDRVRDPVGGRLIGVEDTVQELEVVVVLREERTGQDVTEQKDDAHDFVGLHASRDDPFGKIAGVPLKRVDTSGLEHFDVVVVDRRRLGADLLRGHRLQQVRRVDPPSPLAAQLALDAHEGGRRVPEVGAGSSAAGRVFSDTASVIIDSSSPCS